MKPNPRPRPWMAEADRAGPEQGSRSWTPRALTAVIGGAGAGAVPKPKPPVAAAGAPHKLVGAAAGAGVAAAGFAAKENAMLLGHPGMFGGGAGRGARDCVEGLRENEVRGAYTHPARLSNVDLEARELRDPCPRRERERERA